MKTALKLISLTLLVFSIGVTSNHAQSESEPIEESSPIPPRLVEMGEGSPHPFALIKTLDPENGFVVFDWVSSEGAKLDGGNSIARFAPLTADMETGEFATLTDAEIASAILAPEPQAAVPVKVTRRQLKQWLIVAEKLAAVEGALNAIPDATTKAIALNWWAESQDFERAHPLVAAIAAAPAVGMSSAEIDQAFREMANL